MLDPLAAFSRARPRSAAAAAIAILGALTIAIVYFYQFVLGYQPCHLCLEQRNAYYAGIPLAVLLWVGAENRAAKKVMIIGFVMIALVMLWNAGLSAFHAGVEWKFWPGPPDCTGPVNSLGSALDLRNSLNGIHIPRCDEAAWRFLGISFAGYDVLVSLVLAVIAGWGAKASLAHRHYPR